VYSTIQLLLCKILFLLSYRQPNSPELVAIEYKIRVATRLKKSSSDLLKYIKAVELVS